MKKYDRDYLGEAYERIDRRRKKGELRKNRKKSRRDFVPENERNRDRDDRYNDAA